MKQKLKQVNVRLFCDDWEEFKKKHPNASDKLRLLIKKDLKK